MSLYEKYYNTLGLGDNVSFKEVKEDYQKLAKKYYSDKSGGQEKMRDINFAYEYLIDNVDFSSIDENSNQKINRDFYFSNNAYQKDNDFNFDFRKITSVDEALNLFSLKHPITLRRIKSRHYTLLKFSNNPYKTNQINGLMKY